MALALIAAFLFWWQGYDILISNQNTDGYSDSPPVSSISGLACGDNAGRRPIAVMFSADPITRPLSGISQADIVFEMPVTPGGVTRMMAVYQCESPEEVGSIRSAREDFIPLAAGLGAIYAHWGGEKEALKMLDGHIMDNIDAMKYENVYFYRKKGMRQPHNGFSGLASLFDGAVDLGYGLNDEFEGYPHSRSESKKNIVNLTDSVSIDYPIPFKIRWQYDQENNGYYRFRNNTPELDKLNGGQVFADVVVVMKTASEYINLDYIRIIVSGTGSAKIYQGGGIINGYWSKDPAGIDSKLFFFDNTGKEIEFEPGKIWVEIAV